MGTTRDDPTAVSQSVVLNRKLSTERADNVTNFLEQQGGIPLTNMLAPGATGTSKQVGPDTTSEGQAENCRVVVRICRIRASPAPRFD